MADLRSLGWCWWILYNSCFRVSRARRYRVADSARVIIAAVQIDYEWADVREMWWKMQSQKCKKGVGDWNQFLTNVAMHTKLVRDYAHKSFPCRAYVIHFISWELSVENWDVDSTVNFCLYQCLNSIIFDSPLYWRLKIYFYLKKIITKQLKRNNCSSYWK